MNESELRTYCLEHAGEPMPAEAEALLRRDAELKRQVDRLVAVKNLMSLKNYEQPSAGSLDRCLRGVRAQIAQPVSVWDRIREAFTFEQPALAYGVAALVLAVAGAAVVLNRGTPAGPAFVEQTPETTVESVVSEPVVVSVEPVEPDPEPQVVVAETFPAFDKPWIVLRTENTNIQPSRPGMSIGGGQVVPVSFEY